ncbi:unnamed protein product [Closterium sp. Naga37s-1]|nr:unnamed protein product [Closterium sp. Naga37s-1]
MAEPRAAATAVMAAMLVSREWVETDSRKVGGMNVNGFSLSCPQTGGRRANVESTCLREEPNLSLRWTAGQHERHGLQRQQWWQRVEESGLEEGVGEKRRLLAMICDLSACLCPLLIPPSCTIPHAPVPRLLPLPHYPSHCPTRVQCCARVVNEELRTHMAPALLLLPTTPRAAVPCLSVAAFLCALAPAQGKLPALLHRLDSRTATCGPASGLPCHTVICQLCSTVSILSHRLVCWGHKPVNVVTVSKLVGLGDIMAPLLWLADDTAVSADSDAGGLRQAQGMLEGDVVEEEEDGEEDREGREEAAESHGAWVTPAESSSTASDNYRLTGALTVSAVGKGPPTGRGGRVRFLCQKAYPRSVSCSSESGVAACGGGSGPASAGDA